MPLGNTMVYGPSVRGPRVYVDRTVAYPTSPHQTSAFTQASKTWGSWFFWGYNREVKAFQAAVAAPGASVSTVADALQRVVTYSDNFFPVDFFVDERSEVKSWHEYFRSKVAEHGNKSWRSVFSDGPVEMTTQTESNQDTTATVFATSGHRGVEPGVEMSVRNRQF